MLALCVSWEAHCPTDCGLLAEPYLYNLVVELDEFDRMVERPHW